MNKPTFNEFMVMLTVFTIIIVTALFLGYTDKSTWSKSGKHKYLRATGYITEGNGKFYYTSSNEFITKKELFCISGIISDSTEIKIYTFEKK